MINQKEINTLPSTFGVYLFKKEDKVLYVGKSVNIKARVRSHLENARLDRKEFLIVNQSDNIQSITTDSEFKALILESQLIKKYLPKYNVIWKDNKNFLYIKITIKEEFPKILLCRKENDKKSLYFGPFSSTKVADVLIGDIRRVIPFCTQKKISKTPCFYSKIGLCRPCPNYISQLRDEKLFKEEKKKYRTNIRKVINLLRGRVDDVIKELNKKLKIEIDKQLFEEAIVTRNKIFRLERLIHFQSLEDDILLIDKDKVLQELKKLIVPYFPRINELTRIEGYDISNLGEKNQVGSMIVLQGGIFNKDEYRKFRIKDKQSVSDFDRLEEVLKRRFKQNWLIPDLIIVDGGRPQVRLVMKILKKINKKISVIGIAKNPDRLVIGIDKLPIVRPEKNNLGFNLIRLTRDESHRFARKYHLFLREKDFLV